MKSRHVGSALGYVTLPDGSIPGLAGRRHAIVRQRDRLRLEPDA
jgi:hypothetical protein